jgi:ubiquinone/menaquinone biosynthesis C-methylase UbiE
MLKREDRDKITSLYSGRLGQDLTDYKLVGWGSKESQDLRFKILTEIPGFQNAKSVMDIGCGLGDFKTYLTAHHLDVASFIGIDLCKEFVDMAQARHLSPGTRFYHCDIDELPDDVIADVVVMSGALNVRISDNWTQAERVLRSMFRRCKRGVAANFLTSYVDFSTEKDFHYEPERMLQCGLNITRRATIRHDYPLYEFTIFLHKEI